VGIPPDRIELIPNGVDNALERAVESPREIRSRLRVSEDVPLVLCPKTTIKDDVRSVLDAMVLFKRSSPVLVLPERDPQINLRKMVEEMNLADRVRIVEPIPHERIFGYFRAVQAVVIPYVRESYGLQTFVTPSPTASAADLCLQGFISCTNLSTLEALASGTPTIIAVPNIPPKIDSEDVAALVPAWNPGELARGLCTLLGNPSLRERLGENGRRFVQEYFTWDQTALRLSRLYDRIVQTRVMSQGRGGGRPAFASVRHSDSRSR